VSHAASHYTLSFEVGQALNNLEIKSQTMKKLLAVFSSLFIAIPASADVTSTITDSVQLTVQGAAVQTDRIGASYSVSGSNISATSFGGTAGAGTYDINTAGQAFSFNESFNAADATTTTSQTVATGQIAAPHLFGNSTTQIAGDAGSLAGTLSGTGVPTVTAGGSGTTAVGQRTIELSVFQ